MKILRNLALLLMLLPTLSTAAEVSYLKIHLMQPKDLIENKIGSIDEMSRYIKQVEVGISDKLASISSNPTWGFLVIAVRNDGKIKAWLDTDEQVLPSITTAMIEIAQTTNSFPVNAGAVIFSLGFAINGADIPPNTMPFPNEWKTVSKCSNEDCADQNAEEIVLGSW